MCSATLTRRSLSAALAVLLPWLCQPSAHAVEITSVAEPMASSRAQPLPVRRLRLTGMIVPGDADKLRDVLQRSLGSGTANSNRPSTIIELSSMGGNLADGFQMGRIFREFNVIAVVRGRDLCMSSCALAFLGGNVHQVPSTYPTECNVEIGGKVAFHNFWLNPAGLRGVTSEDPVASRLQGFTDARGGIAMLAKYAGEMGLPPTFVPSIIGRPVEDFQYLETVGQFLSLHVCPIGLERPRIPLEAQAKNICVNSIGESDREAPLQTTAIPEARVKLSLLERLQANMQSSKAKGRLAAQLASGAVMRVQQEIDRLYDDLRVAGVALPDIVGPTFEVGRNRSGTYEPVCYVSLSPDDPDKFDVAIQGPRGFSEPPHAPPDNARRLFLFERNAVINPRP